MMLLFGRFGLLWISFKDRGGKCNGLGDEDGDGRLL